MSSIRALEIANAFPALRIVAQESSFSIDAIEQAGVISTIAGRTSVEIHVVRKLPIVFVGWAIDSKAKAAAAGVYVTIDGQRRFAALYGNSRPDVGASIGLPDVEASGFAAAIPEGSLTPGRHSVFLDIVNARASAVYREPTSVALIVSP